MKVIWTFTGIPALASGELVGGSEELQAANVIAEAMVTAATRSIRDRWFIFVPSVDGLEKSGGSGGGEEVPELGLVAEETGVLADRRWTVVPELDVDRRDHPA